MRVLFWILLLGNLAFFAVMQWGLPMLAGESAIQTQPALHVEKIRLLDATQTGPETASQSQAAPASQSQAVPDAASPAPSPATPATPASDPATCTEWSEFTGNDLARATAGLAALKLGDKLSQRQVEHSIGYWVYIPPLKDKAAVSQKISQLKARNINDYFVVTEAGKWQNAISLGVFKTPEAAQTYLEGLLAKDVRSAQVGERTSKFKTTIFVLNGLDAATEDKLAAMQKDFPGSELKSIPCAH